MRAPACCGRLALCCGRSLGTSRSRFVPREAPAGADLRTLACTTQSHAPWPSTDPSTDSQPTHFVPEVSKRFTPLDFTDFEVAAGPWARGDRSATHCHELTMVSLSCLFLATAEQGTLIMSESAV